MVALNETVFKFPPQGIYLSGVKVTALLLIPHQSFSAGIAWRKPVFVRVL